MHGHTRGEMLQMYYKDRNGVHVLYQERDMQYDAAQRYWQKEGGSRIHGEDGCTTSGASGH